MQKSQADRIIKNYVKPLYGFAVNKMYDFAQAEELASAIVLEVYQVLLKQDNIANINSYIFKIAHNVWVRFIDEKYKIGLCELSEHISDNSDFVGELEDTEMTGMLRREIAYLSETQRKILVAYYFKNQKVREISSRLEIPENTVKWHLSCARKELKIGMDKIRTMGNLGVNPVKFGSMGHNGHAGTKGDTADFLAKSLTQNIAYAAYRQDLTINEIAEELGVNPIFIRDEVEYLEEYGFMDKLDGGKYRTHIQLYEPTEESTVILNELADQYAEIFAEKFVSPALESVTEIPDWLTIPDKDINLMKWCMVFFLVDNLSYTQITDEKFSVKRKDGGNFVATADVYVDTSSWTYNKPNIPWQCGQMWRNNKIVPGAEFKWDMLKKPSMWKSWQIDCYWTDREGYWRENKWEDYDKLYFYLLDQLPENEYNAPVYQRLLEKGYLIKTDEGYKVNLILCTHIDQWYKMILKPSEEILDVSREYAKKTNKANLINQPAHMHEQIKYYNQSSACNLGARIAEKLLQKGMLKMPTDEQKKGLLTIMFLGQ